jgi:hypothetical protein
VGGEASEAVGRSVSVGAEVEVGLGLVESVGVGAESVLLNAFQALSKKLSGPVANASVASVWASVLG